MKFTGSFINFSLFGDDFFIAQFGGKKFTWKVNHHEESLWFGIAKLEIFVGFNKNAKFAEENM